MLSILGVLCSLGTSMPTALPMDQHLPFLIQSQKVDAKVSEKSAAADPVFLGYPHGPRDSQFVPKGRMRKSTSYELNSENGGAIHIYIARGKDSFPVEVGAKASLGAQFGRAQSQTWNAVYQRDQDQLLVFPDSAKISVGQDGYSLELRSPSHIEAKHDYVRDHLGYFLWNRQPVWKEPIAGWCSWMAHLQGVSESDVLAAADFFSRNLLEYGYNVIQVDDGYQRAMQTGKPPIEPGERFSDRWAIGNERFPSGLKDLAGRIKAKGMTPGIWVGLFLPLGLHHAEGYILGVDGKPHRGPWVNYAVNGLDDAALDEAYLETIRKLKAQGWDYFKIDTLRHVLYDNYRVNPAYWSDRGQSMETAFRRIMEKIKSEAGAKTYVLACWGTMPELAGVADGCRVGEDVAPDLDSIRRAAKYIAQFQHLNNVVWHNDPDYACLRLETELAKTWVTLTSLTGGHLMVSDPMKDYDAARVDILRRVGPPMKLRPAALQPLAPDPQWLHLSAEKDGEQWTVAARMAWQPLPASAVHLQDLGLERGKKYLAYDFWNERFLGVVQETSPFSELTQGHSQVVCFRPALDRPQVLGTNRHIGQGVVELKDAKWDGTALSGQMLLGKGRQWSLYLHVPAGFEVDGNSPKGWTLVKDGSVLKLTATEGSGWAKWKLSFRRR
ncbi:MAG: hypothetical protein IT203_10995 [Fimbriimonadaceae bacterium]|nr:hypothetical protein [Fimbriimonadaceae bacterium]